MDRLSPALVYPIIIVAGVLQAWGPPMKGALRNSPSITLVAGIVLASKL